jgi:hypothetical protein
MRFLKGIMGKSSNDYDQMGPPQWHNDLLDIPALEDLSDREIKSLVGILSCPIGIS